MTPARPGLNGFSSLIGRRSSLWTSVDVFDGEAQEHGAEQRDEDGTEEAAGISEPGALRQRPADQAAELMASVADNTYDFVHSSHCLEHMRDPARAMHNWLRILKPGGHLVCLVPDEDLYEQLQAEEPKANLNACTKVLVNHCLIYCLRIKGVRSRIIAGQNVEVIGEVKPDSSCDVQESYDGHRNHHYPHQTLFLEARN